MALGSCSASRSCFGSGLPPRPSPTYPQLTGRVVDDADLLSAADIAELDADLKALEDKSSDQVVVVTLPSLQGYTIEDFGYQLGRHWGIGTKEKDNGVLLIVAPNERKVRIEVGRGLEPLLTDAMSNVIINGAILPRFRTGDYAGGIKEGVKGIELVLTGDAAELAERVKGRRDADDPKVDWLVVIFWTLIILWFIWVTWRSTQRQAHRSGECGPSSSPARLGWRLGRRRLERWQRRGRLLRRRRELRRRRLLGQLVGHVMELFSAEERATIEAAITKAERKTSGEIVVVAATASAGYFAYAHHVGGASRAPRALAADLSHQLAGRAHLSRPARRLRHRRGAHPMGGFALRHRAANPSSAPARIRRPSSSSWRRASTPPRAAPACMIYVSFAERYAEVIADEGIYRKVPQATWNEVVDTLTAHLARGARVEGFVTAIETCGKILAEHFPPGSVDHDELPNHLIVLDGRWSA